MGVFEKNDIRNHSIDENHLPNKQWLLNVLSTLSPEDEIFRKDYQPPVNRKLKEEQKSITISKAFFQGLPDSRSKKKRKRLSLISEGRIR